MLFQQEFSKFHAIAETTLYDSTKGRGGVASVEAADAALRVLEDRMNELDRAIIEIHEAIKKAQS
jgi:hypothetical protein